MECAIFHKDFGALISNYPKPVDLDSICKALRFFYLAVLKRFPRISDFKVANKGKNWTAQSYEKWPDNVNGTSVKNQIDLTSPLKTPVIIGNLDDWTYFHICVTAETLAVAKLVAIHTFVTRNLRLPLEDEKSLTEYEQIQLSPFSKTQHGLFLTCEPWTGSSINEMQKIYYHDRKVLGISDFAFVGFRKTVDPSICMHLIPGNALSLPNQNISEIQKFVLKDHIQACLGLQIDTGENEREEVKKVIASVENNNGNEGEIYSWSREWKLQSRETSESIRKVWISHPYFNKVEYQRTLCQGLKTASYAVIKKEYLETLPQFAIDLYSTYTSLIPNGFSIPPTIEQTATWTRSKMEKLYNVYKEHQYDTACFSAAECFTLPEQLKFCAEPPIPRKLVKKWKYAQAMQLSILFEEWNPYDISNFQTTLTAGFCLLAHIRLWQIIPPRTKKLERKKKEPNKVHKNKKESTEFKLSAQELSKLYLLMTVDFPETIYKELSKLPLFTCFPTQPGSSPTYPKYEEKPLSSTYEKYTVFLKGKPPMKIVCHTILKTVKTINQFVTWISGLTGLPYEMLFDPNLAICACEAPLYMSMSGNV